MTIIARAYFIWVRAGVKCICYNFYSPYSIGCAPILPRPLSDGSTCLAFNEEEVLAMDPATSDLSLPGWDESYTKEQLRTLLKQYEEVDEARLWDNLVYFLNGIRPACETAGIVMAIHPDDPPWEHLRAAPHHSG